MAKEIADNERLSIDSVINKTCGLSEYLLYATPINPEETAAIINNLQDLFKEGAISSTTSGLIQEIDPCLKKTDSTRFYKGEVAQQNINNMTTVGENINTLSSAVNEFDVTEITSLINQYNEALKDLKKDSRKKLLETAANEFNEKHEEWEPYPKTKTYRTNNGMQSYPSYPGEDSEFNYCYAEDDHTEEYDYEAIDSGSSQKDIKDSDGNVVQTINEYSTTYRVHKYKKIKYWDFFKIIQSPFDPSFKEIEAMFDKVGCEVPYDRNNPEIQADKNTGNNWGWNG